MIIRISISFELTPKGTCVIKALIIINLSVPSNNSPLLLELYYKKYIFELIVTFELE